MVALSTPKMVNNMLYVSFMAGNNMGFSKMMIAESKAEAIKKLRDYVNELQTQLNSEDIR